jgi:D-proline reductase (dithiol) PrdB
MPVDSFQYLPRIIATFYQLNERHPELPIPWTALPRPLSDCKFGLITSAGLFQRDNQPPFDIEREKEQPSWGDPSYRELPTSVAASEVGVSHLHLNTRDILQDINIVLPVNHFQELVFQGQIGGLAEQAYSFMGYQGFPPNTSEWQECFVPEVAEKLISEGVDCLLITPA